MNFDSQKRKILVLVLFIALISGIGYYLQRTNSNNQAASFSDVEKLGHFLFFDQKLSLNQAKSCSSCHDPKFAFTDGYRKSVGIKGDVLTRNSQTLINVKHLKSLTWIHPELHSLEKQMEIPLFGTEPIEMGMDKKNTEILSRFSKDALYQTLFLNAFPKQKNPFNWENIQLAIGEYLRTLESFESRYDKNRKDPAAFPFTESESKGETLFFSPELKCGVCHPAPHFTIAADFRLNPDTFYYNIGLYNLEGKGDYPPQEQGLFALTNRPQDKGRFRVPPLRNLVFTAPYMHNGSIRTLEEVIRIFAEGGQNVKEAAYNGDGRKNPFKHPLISGFTLKPDDTKALTDFLLTLTDSTILENSQFQNPFTQNK